MPIADQCPLSVPVFCSDVGHASVMLMLAGHPMRCLSFCIFSVWHHTGREEVADNAIALDAQLALMRPQL